MPLVDDLAAKALVEAEIPGLAVAAIGREGIVFARGYGWANVEHRIPVQASTVFLIGSPSKLVVAAVVFALAEREMLELDADVGRWLPFTLRHPAHTSSAITLRMLLSHRASIVDDEDAMRAAYVAGDSHVPLADWLRAHCGFSDDAPGERVRYANTGMAVAALAAEIAGRMPFSDLARALVFRPLGMATSSFRLRDVLDLEPATPYETLRKPLAHHGYPDYPTGTLRTSVMDFARFALCILAGGTVGQARVLSPESVDAMLGGLGFRTFAREGRALFGHEGADAGAGSSVLCDVERGTAVLVFGNARWTHPAERRLLLAPLEDALFGLAAQTLLAGGGDL
jgi:CubicO group peptidase (beta-lactamase class C family)